jgi:2-keto-4-pentenoate hydratase/2-oxohepta-3-ene-1,7-dioic acid hydratase in catechol pathway
MQIVRFRAGSKTRYGALEGSTVVEYAGTPWSVFKRGRHRYALKQVVPRIFLKPISAVVGPDDPIVLPPQSTRVEHEAELAVVVKKRCRNVPAERARDYVLGYTCVNDVTARDLQARDRGPTRAKAFDTFCPLGPCIATGIEPNAVTVEAFVNGVVRQSGSTKDFIFPVEDLIARISEIMTLLPGDVIATGTPAGVGPLSAGDRVEIRIDGVGALKNPVVKL